MTWRMSKVCGAVSALYLSGVLAVCGQVRGTEPAVKTVDWQPGVCAVVSDGDVLVLEWNPAFETSADATGLQEMKLHLAKRGDDLRDSRHSPGFDLTLWESRVRAGVETDSVKPLPNGFYQIRFPVHLNGVDAGEYHVVSARAFAATEHAHGSRPPEMTNKPTRLPYCVTVSNAAANERTAR